MRRPGRWALQGVAVLFVALVVLEVSLRLASSFAEDRSGAGWRPGVRTRILAIGDSHTFGPAVEPGEAYPGKLQTILDERAPGIYSVINVGIPGTNTTQNLNRLALNLARWDPDLIIVWCGVNNAWNTAETTGGDLLARLDAMLIQLRVYKFLRLWRSDRRMQAGPGLVGNRHLIRHLGDGTHAVPFFGAIETESRENGEQRIDDEAVEAALRDYRAMMELAEAHDKRILFIRYQFSALAFRVPNLALDRLAESDGALVADAEAAMAVLPEERRIGWALHPSPEGYEAIARAVADQLVILAQPPGDESRATDEEAG